MKRHISTLTAAAIAVGLPTLAGAATERYVANLKELNGSGVSGRVDFTIIDSLLRVEADIRGLEPLLPHVNHIHGTFDADGNPTQSQFPGTEAELAEQGFEVDGDGLVEVLEALPKYGDVLLSLENPLPTPESNHNGPIADENGVVSYVYEFMLTDPDPMDISDDPFFSTVSGADYQVSDLFPFDFREYVIHGAFVPGSTLNEGFSFVPGTERADGTGYSATLPVAAAVISPVPLPAGAVLLLSGLGAFGIARYRRRRAA